MGGMLDHQQLQQQVMTSLQLRDEDPECQRYETESIAELQHLQLAQHCIIHHVDLKARMEDIPGQGALEP